MEKAFGTQGHKEFLLQPSLGTLLILFGKMSQLGQLFETFIDLSLPMG
jgi:hypothetical protein